MKKKVQKQIINLTTHSQCVLTEEEWAAVLLLRKNRLNVLECAFLCRELMNATSGQVKEVRDVFALGWSIRQRIKEGCSFRDTVAETLLQKKDRSIRTLQDIRQTMNALMRFDPNLADTPIHELSQADCVRLLQGAYAHSPSRFIKARANLSGVFSVACQRGWCKENPVRHVPIPQVKERTIEPLRIEEIKRLVRVAQRPAFSDCLPALGLMLYAGVRPEELRRLEWSDIDWEDRVLYMSPRHTKTGGGRHVPLTSSLFRLLKEGRGRGGLICPSRWVQRWRLLREAAGFSTWIPDVLRHSYASYHAKMYQDLPRLQLAMGHRDCQQLLTRYVNMRGISRADARVFWRGV